VVHHGGAGTTAAALRAGVPAVVVPFHGDQPFWAAMVHARGVGPAPVPRKKLSVERLATALREAAHSDELAGAARQLGEKIRAEDGVGRAIASIVRLAGQQR
jgi:sterol 3beta-glucosyltransferase